MTSWIDHLLTMPAWLVLLVVFAMPCLESAAFVGFVFPGEVALILGGVVASQGRVPLAAVIAVAILGSALGDSVGYGVGRRYGQRLLDGRLGHWLSRSRLAPARAYLAHRGAAAVFLGRFTATLRVLIPGLAGMAGMRYRKFLGANLASAFSWAPMSVMFGFVGGHSWQHVKHLASWLGVVAVGLLVVVLVAGHLWTNRHGPLAHRSVEPETPEPDGPDDSGDGADGADVAAAEAATPAGPESWSDGEDPADGAMHVLVADDEPRLVDLVSAYLVEHGIATETAYDGQQALDATHRTHPDAVVIDLMMPGLSGLEVLRRLRAEGNAVPVVILTARGSAAERAAGLESGADDYLVKPVAMTDLYDRLLRLWRREHPAPVH